LAVAKSFATALELRSLMVPLRIGTRREDNSRKARSELEADFAAAMALRQDAMTMAMAIWHAPRISLGEAEVEEIFAAEGAAAEGAAAAEGNPESRQPPPPPPPPQPPSEPPPPTPPSSPPPPLL